MTIYTDGVHLVTDQVDLGELHAFAGKLGLMRRWFHNGDHYDLTTRAKAIAAVQAGAVLIAARELGYVVMRRRWRKAGTQVEDGDPVQLREGWTPTPLDPARAADKNDSLMRRFRKFAGRRRIARRAAAE